MLIVLCEVAVVAIVVEQDTGVIVHSHIYDVNGIISNLDRCRTFCHVVVEAYQQQGRTVSVWYIRPIPSHPVADEQAFCAKSGLVEGPKIQSSIHTELLFNAGEWRN